MILINKKIKLLTLFIAIIIIFNFIFIPQKVHAIDPITLTLGALYTYEVAQAIYLTAITATALGVTFATVQELKKFHDVVEGTSPAPLNYPGWERAIEEVKRSKSDLASEHWFSQWGLEVLPGGQQDPQPDNNSKRGILALLGGIGVMGGYFNNYLSMFQTLELDEGDNQIDITNNNHWYYHGFNVVLKNIEDKTTGSNRIVGHFKINNEDYNMLLTNGTALFVSFNIINIDFLYGNTLSINYNVSFMNDFGDKATSNFTKTISLRQGFKLEDSNIINELPINFNVKNDSPILDYGPYLRKPQPNLIPIPRLNPTITPILNPDGKPKPGIQSIINPDGSIEERYYGDVDDLIKDIVMNTPIDKILNPDSRPYEIKPGPDHIKITYPDQKPIVPYPQPPLRPEPGILPGQCPGPGPYPFPDPRPNPDPYPSPDLPPGIKPGEYPGPGPYPWPDPYVDPNPSPHTPVDPGKQIDYTPWLKIIINWLSIIWNKIPVLPYVEVNPDTPDLITPDPNYIKDKIEVLQSQINTKLNLPDLTPLPALFDGIKCEPIPDGYIGDNKVFDASYVNDLASTIANWQRFLWWIVIILIGANNAYKLIRGTDLITIYGRGGKGN